MACRIPLRILQGCLWGTALVHTSGLWSAIIKWTRSPSFAQGQTEGEQLALGLAALITVAVEPLAYLLYTLRSVETCGWAGLMVLLPLALTHLASWTVPSLRKWASRWDA